MATAKKVDGLPELPLNIIQEILARLPMESLLRFRDVKESWTSIICDPYFVKLHYDKATEHEDVLYQRRRLLIRNTGCRYSSINLDKFLNGMNLDNIGDNYGDDVSVDTINPVDLTHFIGFMMYCKGLLFRHSMFNSFGLLNPTTCEFKHLPHPTRIYSGSVDTLYRFGFDMSTLDYKVVRGELCEDDDLRFSVYSLRADSWRVLQRRYPYKYFLLETNVKQVNGSVHWLVRRSEDRSSMVIISFLLAEEVVQEIPLPPDFDIIEEKAEYYLSVFEDCLCMGKENDLAFWIMKEYGVVKSWTKISITVPFYEYLHSGFVWKKRHLLLLQDQPGSEKRKKKIKRNRGLLCTILINTNFSTYQFLNLKLNLIAFSSTWKALCHPITMARFIDRAGDRAADMQICRYADRTGAGQLPVGWLAAAMRKVSPDSVVPLFVPYILNQLSPSTLGKTAIYSLVKFNFQNNLHLVPRCLLKY